MKLRIIGLSFLLALFCLSLDQLIGRLEHGAFTELLHGFSELVPALISAQLIPNSNQAIQIACHFVGLAIFSTASLVCSYNFAASRIPIVIQMMVLSLFYQIAVWQIFHAEGHPASMVLTIIISAIAGSVLKKNDQEKQKFETQQIELKLRNDELKESRIALVKQDESERRLLAADLHDQVLNDMRTIQKRFEQFAENPNPAQKDEINAMLKQSMVNIREIMDDLCPAMLEEFGLPAAIEDRLDKSSKVGNFKARFSCTANEELLDKLSAVEKQLVFRLVQESLTNVVKHAGATLVRIAIVEDDGALAFRVSDDGKGIDPSSLSSSSRGTLYMRLRAALIGAKVSWMPGPDNKGTTVEIRVNVQSPSS
jgi:signal transduction histidine kinase